MTHNEPTTSETYGDLSLAAIDAHVRRAHEMRSRFVSAQFVSLGRAVARAARSATSALSRTKAKTLANRRAPMAARKAA